MYPRKVMYNGVYTHYPSFAYRRHGINLCSSYDIAEPLPITNVNICVPPHYSTYGYRRGISYVDYPYYNYLPPIVQTSVQNDVCYYYDNPEMIYDDEYNNTYRLSRSKVQLVDIVPKTKVRTYPNEMVVSTYRPKQVQEQIVIPRSTVVRHTSVPAYERKRPIRVVPLYHSAPQYVLTSRT